jgi:peroxiredoxin
VVFGSDADGQVGAQYGAYDAVRKTDNRTLYVIDGQGRITYKAQPFRQMAADAYTELEAEIDKLVPKQPGQL